MGLGLRKKLSHLRNELAYAFRNKFGRPNIYDLILQSGGKYLQLSIRYVRDRSHNALRPGAWPETAICLEIGVRWGGSARIIANAMEENGIGTIVGIDPEPRSLQSKGA